MELMPWEESHSVKIKSIDEQHKKLFLLVNQLFDDLKAGRASDRIDEVLKDLVEYAQEHFDFEEKLMHKFQFNGYAAHKEEHNKFRDQMDKFYTYHQAREARICSDILLYLKDWIGEHINGVDKQYTTTFLSHNVA